MNCELPPLSFHFISLPRTASRTRLDLGLGPVNDKCKRGLFLDQFFALFSPNQPFGGVWGEGGGESGGKGLAVPARVVSLKSLVIMPSALWSAGKNA